jgi:hypothetical protein
MLDGTVDDCPRWTFVMLAEGEVANTPSENNHIVACSIEVPCSKRIPEFYVSFVVYILVNC